MHMLFHTDSLYRWILAFRLGAPSVALFRLDGWNPQPWKFQKSV